MIGNMATETGVSRSAVKPQSLAAAPGQVQNATREAAYAVTQQPNFNAPARQTPDSVDMTSEAQKLEALAAKYIEMGDMASAKMIRSYSKAFRRGNTQRVLQGADTTTGHTGADSTMLEGIQKEDAARASSVSDVQDVYSAMGLRPSQSQATQFLQEKYKRELTPDEADIVRQSNDEQIYTLLSKEGAF